MLKTVLISGSLRRESANSAVLATVRRLLLESVPDAEISVLSPGLLPYFDQDLEAEDSSAAVRAAQEQVADADAVFISTPSYNGAASGVLKNALDWLSRGEVSPLEGRVIALASASPGARGAVDAQPALRELLTRCGALVVEHEPVAVGHAVRRRNPAGEYDDPEVVAALRSLVDTTVAVVRERLAAAVSVD
ncbi:NADPH-dependent FMN reductase [Kitasatospora sp. GP82]|uniref:NADPH-dependent FMN reductase n=1 Tax=Kitasatospora sp. GP82 TaxID=3035089 RepID=UPI0024753120|nr:NADPH-dependent FMN reductase [Kitasatospora sp. GP82]MDH6129696.1 chromate reductase [Kitasatospora sp. GP82]